MGIDGRNKYGCQMQTAAMTNKCIYIHITVCTCVQNLNSLQPKFWLIWQSTDTHMQTDDTLKLYREAKSTHK